MILNSNTQIHFFLCRLHMLKERPPPLQYQYMKLIQHSANINLLCVLVGVFQLSDHKIHWTACSLCHNLIWYVLHILLYK